MIYISTTAFKKDFFEDKDDVLLKSIHGIEFSGGNGYYPEKVILEKLECLRRQGIESFLIHNYFPIPQKSFILNFSSGNEAITRQSLSLAEQALNLCRRYHIPYYSFHPGYLSDGTEGPDGHFRFPPDSFISYENALKQYIRNMKQLHRMGTEKGVKLALENLFTAPGNVRTSLNCTFYELDEVMKSIPSDIGLLIDFGHINIASNYLNFDKYEYIDKLLAAYADRIFEIHLSANNGKFDQHLPVTDGDWQLEILPAFRTCPGIDGTGVNVALESRKLDNSVLLESIETIKKHM